MSRRKTKGLSAHLRRVISESGLSIYKISQLTGISQPTLQRFDAGKADLTLGRADALCQFFGIKFTEAEYPKGRK